jgi:hypothetical protein
VTTNAEVPKEIKSKATGACSTGIGTEEFTAEYRQGKLAPTTEFPEIEPKGKPAKTISRNVTTPAPANRIATEGEVEEKSAIVKGIVASIPAAAVGWEASTPGRHKILQGAPEPVTTIKTVIKEAAPAEVELSSPVSEPGKGTAKEKVPVVFQEFKPIGGAIGVNEQHWYSQNAGLPAQSGAPGAEGLDLLSWGTLTIEGTAIPGKLVCQNELGGDVYNPQGSTWTSISNLKGEAEPGKLSIDAWHMYDCEEKAGCEVKKSQFEVQPEGLGKVVPEAGKASFEEWGGGIEPAKAEVTLGGATAATEIKFSLLCPTTGSGEIKLKLAGKLKPAFASGTAQSSAPALVTFAGAGTGELTEVGGTGLKANLSNKLSMMGYEAGEFISVKAP